jgi:hypothetical protein
MEDPRGYAYRRRADWKGLPPDEFGALMSGLSLLEAKCAQFPTRRRLRRRRLDAVALFRQLRGPFLRDWWFFHPHEPPPRDQKAFPKWPYRLLWNVSRHDT